MIAMPKRRPLHVHQQRDRNGDPIWYHRVGKGKRTRLWETYGSKAFMAEVAAAEAGRPIPRVPVPRGGTGSLSWGFRLYRKSAAWMELSAATRKQRGNIIDRILKTPAGEGGIADVTKKDIKARVAGLSEKPAAARHFMQTMRGFFKWVLEDDIVAIDVDPTAGIVARAAPTKGFPMWEKDDLSAFEARWPLGTPERVAYAVLLWTGLRRGDAVRVGRPHVRAGVIRIETEKTKAWVAIVIEPELADALAAGPCGDLAFIVGEKGLPRVKESFGEWFRVACRAAGVAKSAHGLRKTAATRDAQNGYTVHELEAKYAWADGGRMAGHYTKAVDREKLSIGAARKRTAG